MGKFNNLFPPRHFAPTHIDPMLLKGPKQALLLPKSEKNKEIYQNFNNQFFLFLSKLPKNNVKNVITDLYNKDKIYILISSTKPETGIVSRVFIDNQNKCLGVGLLSAELDINLKTGESNSIDECVYGAYQGIIRAASIVHKDQIKQDDDIHKLLATYFYLTILKSLGKTAVYSNKQKNFIYAVCLYAYYRHYLDEHPSKVKSHIEKQFKNEKLLDFYDEFEPRFKELEKYTSTKDLPKMFIDTKSLVENPNTINMMIIRNLKLSGYYSLVGPLDLLMSMCILSKYPTEQYTRYSFVSEKIQNAFESLMIKNYINKIKYDSSAILKKDT